MKSHQSAPNSLHHFFLQQGFYVALITSCPCQESNRAVAGDLDEEACNDCLKVAALKSKTVTEQVIGYAHDAHAIKPASGQG